MKKLSYKLTLFRKDCCDVRSSGLLQGFTAAGTHESHRRQKTASRAEKTLLRLKRGAPLRRAVRAYFGGAGVNNSRLCAGSGLGFGLGAFLTSFLPLSLLPMVASVPQMRATRQGLLTLVLLQAATEALRVLVCLARTFCSGVTESRRPTVFRTAINVFSVGLPFGDRAR